MARVVCLDAEKHAVSMMVELHQMKQDNDYCDFIIQVGDDVYPTHKNVLSAGSAYFRAMLKHDTKESREGKVVFKDVNSECVKNCINFIYSSKFEIPDGKIVELLHLAIMMQLEDVKYALSDILTESITVENYFSTRNVGDMYELSDVTSRCRIFLQENIMEIANEAGFESVEKNDLFNLLKSAKSRLWEEDKLMLTLKWIERCEKKEHLYECLEFIEFVEIAPVFLQDLLETHPIIKHDSKLKELIRSHLERASVELVKRKEFIILFDEDRDCIRSFNPISEKITKFHNAKYRHFNCFTSIILDPYMYILCENKSVHRLNLGRKTSDWEKMEDMTFDHGRFPCSVSMSRSIFVIGGTIDKDSNDVERFDPFENQWFQLQKKPTTICDARLVSLDDSIYCIGGWRDDVEVSSFCRFTPSSSEWIELEPMRYSVCTSGAVAVEQKIFVIGGFSYGNSIKNVECYDVTSAQWTSLPPMECCGTCNTAYHIGKWIYIVDDNGDSDGIAKYDLITRKWYRVSEGRDDAFSLCGSVMVKI